MKTILVLFGGCSTEYEVSLHSAYAVLSHMDPARYTPLAVGITREGQWLCYTGDLSHSFGRSVPGAPRQERRGRYGTGTL